MHKSALMIKVFLFAATILSVYSGGYAQTATPIPAPTPDRNEARRRIEENRRNSLLFETLRNGGRPTSDPRADRQIYQAHILSLYRDPTKEELEALTPASEDLERYRDFLRMSNTGIFKLVPDAGCSDSTLVISVKDECMKYTMPGNGSSYSFRKNVYRIPRIADISFNDGHIYSPGRIQHSIMVNIGDVPIEAVNEGTKGMAFLLGFKPSTTITDAIATDDKLRTGIDQDGLVYGRSEKAESGSTYLFRGVAYRGKLLRSVEKIVYDELALDKRRDVIVAFRVIRQGSDGSITIVWREFRRSGSPRLK